MFIKLFKTKFILIFFLLSIKAYCSNSKYRVIVDTDCAIDDFRAICMLMAVEEINIEAFIVSEGTLDVTTGLDKINQIRQYFHRDAIPIGMGKSIYIDPPKWREMNREFSWGESSQNTFFQDSVLKIFSKINKNKDDKFIYLAFGPLTNLKKIIKNESYKNKIEKVIWYCSGYPDLNGFNYEIDKSSADFVLSSEIPVNIIINTENLIFNQNIYNEIIQNKNKFTELIERSFENHQVKDKLLEGHFKIWDDLIPVYLLYPELFDMKSDMNNLKIKYCVNLNSRVILNIIPEIYSQNYIIDKNIVFNSFPVENNLFRYDLQIYIDSIISKHGIEEWKACVITNEFHGHLGIYSIVGAKMGVKAREVLNIPVDRLEVISFAGSHPPISCFNDGLQTSTGATLGQGTILISDEKKIRPEAIFIYGKDTITIALKNEYWNIIKNDISYGIASYGLLTDGYWKLIRKLAIKYWYEFDRDEIFDIKNYN